jgi:hypothetical protein
MEARIASSIDEANALAAARQALQDEYEVLIEQRHAHLVHVDQPLALISQLPRSGGSLLMWLFDGHPQCHAMPIELSDLEWAQADQWLRGTDRAWSAMYNPRQKNYFARGWQQGHVERRKRRSYPLLVAPELQRSLFYRVVAAQERSSKRTLIDAYWTSYFNGWIDNQNLLGSKKRWVTAFTPRLISYQRGVTSWSDIYGDGVMLSITRDPRSWYLSARGWSVEWRRLEVAMEIWTRAADAQLRARELLGERFYLLTFDALVDRREKTMRALARFLGINFGPSLLTPTMNRIPIEANSSFVEDSTRANPSARYRALLTKEEIVRIEKLALGRYEQLRGLAWQDARNRKAQVVPPGVAGDRG